MWIHLMKNKKIFEPPWRLTAQSTLDARSDAGAEHNGSEARHFDSDQI